MSRRKAATETRMSPVKFQSKELAAEHCDNVVDRINQLPDDILISIISRLTLREAIATSILSTRWRHLHAYTARLDFPPFKSNLPKIRNKFSNYISMVNRTLDSHMGHHVLKEFRVHMPHLKGANIKRWLEFVLAREVEIIDIHMYFSQNDKLGFYTLQLSNFIRKNGGQSVPGLKSLKELSLCNVHVDDREVELLLSKSPLLESLSIASSEKLKNVLVVGHSVHKLKHLNISEAWRIESIEVRDMINLVSLRCYSLPSTYILQLNNVPKLIEFNTRDKEGNTLAEILLRMPSCIHDQLQLLKLWTNTLHINSHLSTYKVPELINMKHLELEVLMYANTFPLFPLIEACPSLEKVGIKFLWSWNDTKFEDRAIEKRSPKKKLSPNLKKLKLSGYLGCPEEMEFALFIVKNVVALEELIVEACDLTGEIRQMATARAWQHFQCITRDSVRLVII